MRPWRLLAEAVAQHRAGRDFGVALNEFLDEFYLAGDERQSMIEQAPSLIGDKRLDAYIGATGLRHMPSGGNAAICRQDVIRGQPPDVRKAVRHLRSRPLVDALQIWLQEHLPRVPGWSDLAKAMRYALRHWDGLILYLDDGRLEMDSNVVERAIRPITITRKNSLFARSDAGARHWAIANTLMQTCKLNAVEPLAYLTDVLQRIVSGRTKNQELHTLLPWHWRPDNALIETAA